MIPIRDNVHPNIFPFVTLGLIIANATVFYKELSLSLPALKTLIGSYGMVPATLTRAIESGAFLPGPYLSLLTNQYLHGGWLHIIGNMWYLWIFGYSVEYCLGHANFFAFYMICGIISNLTQIFFDPTSPVPVIGASGAISGVLGAYAVCFPNAKIKTVIPLIFIFTIVEIPAILFLGLWFFLQVISGTSSPDMAGAGIAWWAHVGGFVAGVLLNRFLIKRS